jgi:pimeloyl-ACP methyl ester carboxylesterase
VLLHGSPSDATVFSELVKRAPAAARLVLVDLPDHGSAPDEPTATLEPLEADVLRIGAAEAPRDLVLVGHSLGASLAARVAPKLGQRIARLVLISGFAALPQEFVAGRRALREQIANGEMAPADLAELFVSLQLGSHHAPEHAALLRRLLEQLSADRLLRSLGRANRASGADARVTGYAQPALVLHGTRDQAVPVELGRQLAAMGANARFVELDTDAHLLPLTHADEVARHVFS